MDIFRLLIAVTMGLAAVSVFGQTRQQQSDPGSQGSSNTSITPVRQGAPQLPANPVAVSSGAPSVPTSVSVSSGAVQPGANAPSNPTQLPNGLGFPAPGGTGLQNPQPTANPTQLPNGLGFPAPTSASTTTATTQPPAVPGTLGCPAGTRLVNNVCSPIP